MNVRKLTDHQLNHETVKTAEEERRVTLKLLVYLNEVERRRLYSKYNYPSLHAYCVKKLKMSDSQAGRRVSAARLIKEMPAIEEKILEGSMNLTSASQASVFFLKEERAGHHFNQTEKLEILTEIESKSTREVAEILIANSDQPEIHLKETIKQKTEALSEVRLHLDQETLDLLNKMKEIWSNAMPHASYADIIKRMAKESVERLDPVKKAERAETRLIAKEESKEQEVTFNQQDRDRKSEVTPNSKMKSPNQKPHNWAFIRHHVRLRDQGQCTFTDPRTAERCNSKYFIEEDHVIPKAMGGEYSIENLRLRCRAHNQRHAINTYGFEKMKPYFEKKH